VPAVVAVFNMQNEIIHPDGKIGARGNAAVVAERGVIQNTAALLEAARAASIPVLYVGSGYNSRYDGLNRTVTLFAEHEPEGRLQVGSWGARFHDGIAPRDGDTVFYRGGIGAFAATPIGDHLASREATRVYVAGVSTRLVVEAAVFEFTDRGYAVTVVEDCCAAASPQAHEDAVKTLRMFAEIESAGQVIARISAR
jgi:nicotinamidase-related amidase